jgi:carboxyl-terminal processing protease
VTKDFVVDDAVIADFKDYLPANKITIEEDKFTAARDEIRRELQRSVISILWSYEEGVKVFSKMDPAVLKALEIMPEAAKFVTKAPAP